MSTCPFRKDDWVQRREADGQFRAGQLIDAPRPAGSAFSLLVRLGDGGTRTWACHEVQAAPAPAALVRFSTKAEVKKLQRALAAAHFDPGDIDGIFGSGTEAAVMAFQSSRGFAPVGTVDQATANALGLGARSAAVDDWPRLTVAVVTQMFPFTPMGNIKAHLPRVVAAMTAEGLTRRSMALMALATVRAESAGFVPIDEGKSRYNTSPNARHAFDLYDHRGDIGNQGPPDGDRYKGRGFVQLTGRANYAQFGPQVGVDLVAQPDLANNPEIAAALLAKFIRNKEQRIEQALLHRDLKLARRLVNGGSHGLDEFIRTYQRGEQLLS